MKKFPAVTLTMNRETLLAYLARYFPDYNYNKDAPFKVTFTGDIIHVEQFNKMLCMFGQGAFEKFTNETQQQPA